MYILSTTTKINLFVVVDTAYNGECVNFAFRTELEEEALNTISALPLFLEESLCTSTVWTWFTQDAHKEADFYKWDKDHGIIPKDNEGVNNTQ
jgi:hypothetical protein